MSLNVRPLPLEAWPPGFQVAAPVAHLDLTRDELKARGLSFYAIGDPMTVVVVGDDVLWIVDLPGGRPGTTVVGDSTLPTEKCSEVVTALIDWLDAPASAVEWIRGAEEEDTG